MSTSFCLLSRLRTPYSRVHRANLSSSSCRTRRRGHDMIIKGDKEVEQAPVVVNRAVVSWLSLQIRPPSAHNTLIVCRTHNLRLPIHLHIPRKTMPLAVLTSRVLCRVDQPFHCPPELAVTFLPSVATTPPLEAHSSSILTS